MKRMNRGGELLRAVETRTEVRVMGGEHGARGGEGLCGACLHGLEDVWEGGSGAVGVG